MATTSLQQQSIADTATNWSQTLDFQQFDPSLGTLTGVAVGLTGEVVGNILLENLDLAPATFGVGFNANVEVNAPDSSSLANVAPVANSSVTLAPGAGATLSGISGSASTQVQYQASAQPGGPAAAQFIGTGLVPLPVGAQSSLHLTGPGNMALVSQETAGASVSLQYGYAPANSGNGGTGNAGVVDAVLTLQAAAPIVTGSVTTAAQTFSFAGRTTGWNDSAAVSQFDPALGTLESVNITLSGDVSAGVAAENLGDAAASLNVSDTATLTLDLPGGTPTLTAAASASDGMSLGAFDGSVDYAGTSGRVDQLSIQPSGFSTNTALTGVTNLTPFTGQGVVVLPISTTSAAIIDGPGNLAAGLVTAAGAAVSVSYTYLPATTGTAGDTGSTTGTSGGTGYTITDLTTNRLDTTTAAQPYAGGAGGPTQELIDGSADNLAISLTSDNWVIGTDGGNDVIIAHGGDNILNANGGSNWLFGAGGDDTFSLHAGASDTWNTVVNFHAGDWLVVWGVSPQDFAVSWLNGVGGDGYRGLTMDATAADGTVTAVTLARYYSTADFSNGRLTTGFGTDAATGAHYLYVHANS